MSRHALIVALAKHAGQPLTPAVAVQILDDLYPDRTIDPAQFAPLHHQGYVIAVESFRAIVEELKPLHVAHWAETETYRHCEPLNPNYEQAGERERAGRALQFTVRKDGELVGHLQMYLVESEHTQTALSQENTLFIRKDHRGGFLVMKLIRYVVDVLVRVRGEHLIEVDSKLANRADVLMRRAGFEPFALRFAMRATPLPGRSLTAQHATMNQEPAHVPVRA